MKKILTLLMISLSLLADAQLETYGRYTAGGYVEPDINLFVSKKITRKVSLSFFGLVEQKWSQALIGVTFAPVSSISVAAFAGIEQGTNSPRYAVSFWRKKGRTSFLAWWEQGSGKANYLYKSNLFHQYSDHCTLGITAWRNHGIGPNVRFTIPKLATTIWSMPAYDFESGRSRLMIGVSVNMKEGT